MIDADAELIVYRVLTHLGEKIEKWDRLAGGRWEYQELLSDIYRCLKLMRENGVGVAGPHASKEL